MNTYWFTATTHSCWCEIAHVCVVCVLLWCDSQQQHHLNILPLAPGPAPSTHKQIISQWSVLFMMHTHVCNCINVCEKILLGHGRLMLTNCGRSWLGWFWIVSVIHCWYCETRVNTLGTMFELQLKKKLVMPNWTHFEQYWLIIGPPESPCRQKEIVFSSTCFAFSC